jgi:hypothetical protein
MQKGGSTTAQQSIRTSADEVGLDLLLLQDEELHEVIKTALAVRGLRRFLHSLPLTSVASPLQSDLPGIERLRSVDILEFVNKPKGILDYVRALDALPEEDFKALVCALVPEVSAADIDALSSIGNVKYSYAMLIEGGTKELNTWKSSPIRNELVVAW